MGSFCSITIRLLFGFALGVGGALAVMYTIYTNGYTKGIEHSLLREKPKGSYLALLTALKRFKKSLPCHVGFRNMTQECTARQLSRGMSASYIFVH